DECAVHIGFAKLELGVEEKAKLRGSGGETHRHWPACPVAKCEGFSGRGRNLKRTPPNECPKQNTKQPVHRPPPSLGPRVLLGHAPKNVTPRTHKSSDLGI